VEYSLVFLILTCNKSICSPHLSLSKPYCFRLVYGLGIIMQDGIESLSICIMDVVRGLREGTIMRYWEAGCHLPNYSWGSPHGRGR